MRFDFRSHLMRPTTQRWNRAAEPEWLCNFVLSHTKTFRRACRRWTCGGDLPREFSSASTIGCENFPFLLQNSSLTILLHMTSRARLSYSELFNSIRSAIFYYLSYPPLAQCKYNPQYYNTTILQYYNPANLAPQILDFNSYVFPYPQVLILCCAGSFSFSVVSAITVVAKGTAGRSYNACSTSKATSPAQPNDKLQPAPP